LQTPEDRLASLAAELVRLRIDLLVAGSTPAAQAANEATATIPIVFWLSSDPVRSGLVSSFAQPTGTLTDSRMVSTNGNGWKSSRRLAVSRRREPEGPRRSSCQTSRGWRGTVAVSVS
jgi:hypothetical protein